MNRKVVFWPFAKKVESSTAKAIRFRQCGFITSIPQSLWHPAVTVSGDHGGGSDVMKDLFLPLNVVRSVSSQAWECGPTRPWNGSQRCEPLSLWFWQSDGLGSTGEQMRSFGWIFEEFSCANVLGVNCQSVMIQWFEQGLARNVSSFASFAGKFGDGLSGGRRLPTLTCTKLWRLWDWHILAGWAWKQCAPTNVTEGLTQQGWTKIEHASPRFLFQKRSKALQVWLLWNITLGGGFKHF